jgi:hypothetical protein
MERSKSLKQVYDLALGTGRSWQNSQTGWIHYCYHLEDEETHFPIPVYENFLYALALMKSKVGDNIQEAKQLLEKLIAFQSENFPVYLHDFPKSTDKWLPIQLLPIYAHIFEGFQQVLGENLKAVLTQSLTKLVDYTLQQIKEQMPPYHLTIKLGGVLIALGRHFKNDAWQTAGENMLKDALQIEDRRAWFAPSMIGEMLVGLLLAYPKIINSPWGPLWADVCNSWSVRIGAFAAPSWKELQEGREPQTTLYDLFMSVYSGAFPYRSFADHPVQLQAVLIPENTEKFPHDKSMLCYDNWYLKHQDKYTIAVMSKTAEIPQAWEKGHVPFKILWGDLNRYRSLVLQGGNYKTLSYELRDRGMDLIIELDEPIEKDSRDRHREICLFTEYYEGDQLLVSEAKATTFKLDDQVTLHSEGRHFQVTFQQIQGSGEFMGHIMRGNRPSQIGVKGKHRVEAFDWMIFIRTVRRTGICRFLLSINVDM